MNKQINMGKEFPHRRNPNDSRKHSPSKSGVESLALPSFCELELLTSQEQSKEREKWLFYIEEPG